ncbi:hypothetical protein Hamer_G013675 [Homarus americanus]|uniref:UBA domain-containing protein n=2 Tax=Homarus americanus TaxID=6706 RepID=A0A8J5JY37_HOMAM|nr:hypothetical protein Hamer_G013675 [Homarus americanus]
MGSDTCSALHLHVAGNVLKIPKADGLSMLEEEGSTGRQPRKEDRGIAVNVPPRPTKAITGLDLNPILRRTAEPNIPLLHKKSGQVSDLELHLYVWNELLSAPPLPSRAPLGMGSDLRATSSVPDTLSASTGHNVHRQPKRALSDNKRFNNSGGSSVVSRTLSLSGPDIVMGPPVPCRPSSAGYDASHPPAVPIRPSSQVQSNLKMPSNIRWQSSSQTKHCNSISKRRSLEGMPETRLKQKLHNANSLEEIHVSFPSLHGDPKDNENSPPSSTLCDPYDRQDKNWCLKTIAPANPTGIGLPRRGQWNMRVESPLARIPANENSLPPPIPPIPLNIQKEFSKSHITTHNDKHGEKNQVSVILNDLEGVVCKDSYTKVVTDGPMEFLSEEKENKRVFSGTASTYDRPDCPTKRFSATEDHNKKTESIKWPKSSFNDTMINFLDENIREGRACYRSNPAYDLVFPSQLRPPIPKRTNNLNHHCDHDVKGALSSDGLSSEVLSSSYDSEEHYLTMDNGARPKRSSSISTAVSAQPVYTSFSTKLHRDSRSLGTVRVNTSHSQDVTTDGSQSLEKSAVCLQSEDECSGQSQSTGMFADTPNVDNQSQALKSCSVSDEDKWTPESYEKGSRSPLMSPGASPRVCRRDDVIPPPPVPPRKASPAPSPPSTPATTHRSSVLEVEEEEEMPPAPPRTLTSLTAPTVVTTPTTPTSPPRTITIVTLDPNNVAVETTTTGPGKERKISAPSPLRHRPLSVPHIVPRTSKLMRASGSNPSLSSSSSSPTSTPATTPTPLPTSTPATTPTPLPSAPPFPSHFPPSSSPSPSFVPTSLPASPSPSSSSQQQQPMSPLGGPPTTTAPPPPVTVITYTPVMTSDDMTSSPEPVTTTTTTTTTVTPRPRTILPSHSTLMPPTPATTPSPSSPSSITSSTSCSSSGSASTTSSGGLEVDRRASGTSHTGDLEDIHEEPPYENTTLPPPVCPASARKSATDSDLPNFPAPSAPSLPTIIKSWSADRSMNVAEGLEGEEAHTAYENLHMDYLATLTQEGFAQDAVIRALVITRNDIAMARDILREFASKRS